IPSARLRSTVCSIASIREASSAPLSLERRRFRCARRRRCGRPHHKGGGSFGWGVILRTARGALANHGYEPTRDAGVAPLLLVLQLGIGASPNFVDRLADRLRLYLALHEGADALDGCSRFGKDPRPDLPGVRHPRPYFEFDLTSGGAHPIRHAHGIIEENLVAADLDVRRCASIIRTKAKAREP